MNLKIKKKKLTNIKKIIKKYYNENKNILKKLKIYVNISGRITSIRKMKKNVFLNIQNIEGNIQILLNEKNTIKYKIIIKNIKLGNILNIKGKVFKTKTNELTIKCQKIKILVKTSLLLPNKFNMLKNKEIKYRKRYLDLITNIKTRKTFITRIKIISLIRKFLTKKNFLEVETPMLQLIPGGANAQPFKTYHNKLNINMYLRISPELYLKQLIIGGFTKIFELNKNFRNEGISPYHNPEFSMIEIYKAYSNYKNMMKLTENIITYLIKSLKKKQIINYGKFKINLNTPYKKISMKKAIYNHSNYFTNLHDLDDEHKLKIIAKKLNICTTKPTGKIIYNIFKLTTEKKLIQPTFITKYPIEISPLAKKNKNNHHLTDRFELFIGGIEIVNGFTELNHSKEQEKRFKQQIKYNKKNFFNKDYIKSLKYGLPPTAGLGLGIDRLVMLLTNNIFIKDVIFFPTLKKNN